MTKGKMILAAVTAILTAGSIFAFTPDRGRGGKQLWTTSAANGCRIANCFTLVGGQAQNPCPSGTYYTQKTTGGKCKNVFSGVKTTAS